MMYNDQWVYKVVIWALFGISLLKEKVSLSGIPLKLASIFKWYTLKAGRYL